MKNLDLRLRFAVIGVLVWLVADFGVATSGALKIAALGGTGAIWSQGALQAVDSFTGAAGMVFSLAYLLSVIAVARWIYRANENAHTLSDELTISPGWAVGWYFVPLMCLYKPFRALRETWQASLSPYDLEATPVPQSMQIWWGLWITTNVLGNISFRLSLNAKTAADFVFGGWVDIVSFAVDVPLSVLLILLMRQLTANQRSIVETSVFE